MLPSKNRLKKGLFVSIYRQGKRTFGKTLSLIYLANKSKFSHFGFVISKKNAVRAVDRNKLKRIMRQSVRCQLPNIKEGYDVAITFIAKNPDLSQKKWEKIINQEIELLFSHSRLMKK